MSGKYGSTVHLDNGTHVRLSNHAQSTMDRRHVTHHEIRDVLEQWENRWSSSFHRGQATPDTYVYQRGKLALVVYEMGKLRLVKTVLLRDAEQWNDSQARARSTRPA